MANQGQRADTSENQLQIHVFGKKNWKFIVTGNDDWLIATRCSSEELANQYAHALRFKVTVKRFLFVFTANYHQ
jgi:hypothetical protein